MDPSSPETETAGGATTADGGGETAASTRNPLDVRKIASKSTNSIMCLVYVKGPFRHRAGVRRWQMLANDTGKYDTGKYRV